MTAFQVRHAELKRWVKSKERPHFIHTFQEGAMGFRTLIILTVWIATALVYYGIVIALSDQVPRALPGERE